jgi:hypothetical protein
MPFYPSISLIESISPFRLIEHRIRLIVNSVEGFRLVDPIWPGRQHSRNRKPPMRDEVETRGL